jgi:AraC-like DNA-binding protein
VVRENSYLILNDRQRYTITIDSARKVTTFCLFFQRGFVEDVYCGTVTPAATLLDSPSPANSLVGFSENLETRDGLLESIRQLRRRMLEGTSRDAVAENFYAIAESMIREHKDAKALVAKLPALRLSTRQELYRRLLRGRDYLLSCIDQPIRLNDMARAACLSPYHFHRAFTLAFGDTPQHYLTRQRLERASHLLRQGHRAVTEVCLESGFESLSSFSSLFRRHFGLSPREFRRAQNGKLAR